MANGHESGSVTPTDEVEDFTSPTMEELAEEHATNLAAALNVGDNELLSRNWAAAVLEEVAEHGKFGSFPEAVGPEILARSIIRLVGNAEFGDDPHDRYGSIRKVHQLLGDFLDDQYQPSGTERPHLTVVE